MTTANRAETREDLFRLARAGNQEAFAQWMATVEIPLRRSLRRFARAVDVEVVVQETLMRMWLLTVNSETVIEGENASLRFAYRVARNVAFEEIRRYRSERLIEMDGLDNLPEGRMEDPVPDPALARAIRECIDRLPSQPRKALSARVTDGTLPDRQLAEALSMKVNTFHQNIVRARRLLSDCLQRRGIRLKEILA